MADEASRVGEKRPGGRAARVRSAVLLAAAAELDAFGYGAFSIDRVASNAGVHKTTVYRRWPTKAELIADAASLQSEENVPIPDTGSFRTDLQQLARQVAALVGAPVNGGRTRAVVGAALTSPELAQSMQRYWLDRICQCAVIVQRGIDRGELPPDADANLITESVIGPIWVRLLLTGEPISENLADATAALVAAGAVAQR